MIRSISKTCNPCFVLLYSGEESDVRFSRRFIAALTEMTFKQCGKEFVEMPSPNYLIE